MGEKLVAGLAAAVLVMPICAICLFGPAALFAILAATAGWIGGIDPVVTSGLGIAVAIVVYGFFRRRAARRSISNQTEAVNQ